jgi:hypothetical protein
MGAVIVREKISANSIQDAFKYAYAYAEDEYGHQQGYSGAINSCEFTKDVTHMLKNMKPNQLIDYIEKHVPKREAWGFWLTPPKVNTNKVKSKVTVNPQKGARKWETIYVAYHRGDQILSDSSQTNCIKKARAYVEKNPNTRLTIQIEKRLVSGNQNCATVEYKSSSNESAGVYVFVGLAAC